MRSQPIEPTQQLCIRGTSRLEGLSGAYYAQDRSERKGNDAVEKRRHFYGVDVRLAEIGFDLVDRAREVALPPRAMIANAGQGDHPPFTR